MNEYSRWICVFRNYFTMKSKKRLVLVQFTLLLLHCGPFNYIRLDSFCCLGPAWPSLTLFFALSFTESARNDVYCAEESQWYDECRNAGVFYGKGNCYSVVFLFCASEDFNREEQHNYFAVWFPHPVFLSVFLTRVTTNFYRARYKHLANWLCR